MGRLSGKVRGELNLIDSPAQGLPCPFMVSWTWASGHLNTQSHTSPAPPQSRTELGCILALGRWEGARAKPSPEWVSGTWGWAQKEPKHSPKVSSAELLLTWNWCPQAQAGRHSPEAPVCGSCVLMVQQVGLNPAPVTHQAVVKKTADRTVPSVWHHYLSVFLLEGSPGGQE